MNICDKYYWITKHPAVVPYGLSAIIEITPHMVCPETNRIERIVSVNTKLRFWVEFMIPFYDEQFNQNTHSHVWDLDCGGDTWEEAVENLYQGVLAKYGDYTEENYAEYRKEAMKDFDMDAWFSKVETFELSDSDYEYAEPVMFDSEELQDLQEEIETMAKYFSVLRNKCEDPDISMTEFGEIETEMMCVDHDLTIAKASLDAGYDVDRYGFPK